MPRTNWAPESIQNGHVAALQATETCRQPNTVSKCMEQVMRTANPFSRFKWNKEQDVPEVLAVLLETINSHSREARQLAELSIRRVKTCTVCSSSYPIINIEQYLLIPVRQSLSQMVEEFAPDEVMEGENAYTCAHCNKKQKAIQRSELASAPLILMMVLRRMEPSQPHGGMLVRSNQHIDYMEQMEIRVKEQDQTERTVSYETLAVIHHTSHSKDSGHYTAHIKSRVAGSTVTITR